MYKPCDATKMTCLCKFRAEKSRPIGRGSRRHGVTPWLTSPRWVYKVDSPPRPMGPSRWPFLVNSSVCKLYFFPPSSGVSTEFIPRCSLLDTMGMKSPYATVAMRGGTHTVTMDPAGCRSGGFLLLEVQGGFFWGAQVGFFCCLGFFLLFSLFFPPQGLADLGVHCGVHAVRLPSTATSLSLFLLTPVATCGGYSQSINIEIQLDACSLGGKAEHFCCARQPRPRIKHGP